MSRITTCPRCSSQLRVPEEIAWKTTICPYCLADVDNPHPGSQIQADDLNTDVKRDVKGSSIALAVLIGLCVCGILMATRLAYLVYLCVIPLLVLSAIIRFAWKRTSDTGASTAGRVVSVLFIVLGTIVAIVIFVFVACSIALSVAWKGGFH